MVTFRCQITDLMDTLESVTLESEQRCAELEIAEVCVVICSR